MRDGLQMGLGAICDSKPVRGLWRGFQAFLHINLLVLLTVYHTLKHFSLGDMSSYGQTTRPQWPTKTTRWVSGQPRCATCGTKFLCGLNCACSRYMQLTLPVQ